MKLQTAIGEDWFNYLSPFLKSEKFLEIQKKLTNEMSMPDRQLVPSIDKIFDPFKNCPLKDLRVVILNDRPVKELNTNDGIALSSSRLGEDVPTEISQFIEAIEDEVYDGFKLEKEYDLHRLSKQGILLINYSMTLAFQGLGINKGEWHEHYELWQPFIQDLIVRLCHGNKGLIFITLGRKPRDFAEHILKTDHYLFTCTHPRDAAHFLQQWDSAGAFSLTNTILKNNNNFKIKW